jgi:hypothetical protein
VSLWELRGIVGISGSLWSLFHASWNLWETLSQMQDNVKMYACDYAKKEKLTHRSFVLRARWSGGSNGHYPLLFSALLQDRSPVQQHGSVPPRMASVSTSRAVLADFNHMGVCRILFMAPLDLGL